jgi:hypothetical protein
MSDSIKGLIVMFDKDYKNEDAESIARAIRMIKGVGKVDFLVANIDDWLARNRVRHELKEKLWDVLKEA